MRFITTFLGIAIIAALLTSGGLAANNFIHERGRWDAEH